MSRWPAVAAGVCGWLTLLAAPATAQRTKLSSPVRTTSVRTTSEHVALDAWLVARFHDVQLLDDSVQAAPSIPSAVRPVRIESTRDGERVDTLFAAALSPDRALLGFRSGTRVRLGASSGSITGIPATILARRFFRAPIRPLSARPDSAWRYGWAYLATTTAVGGKTGSATYRGWLLFPPPDSVRRSASPPGVLPR